MPGWTTDDLRDHLQKAIELEFWTIPLYMSAAYSIQIAGESASDPPSFQPTALDPDQIAFNNIFTVFVQEMLHLELACNLFNACFPGEDLSLIDAAKLGYAAFPSWIKAPTNATVELGPCNANQAQLMVDVETPSDAPIPTSPQPVYDSIGEFYGALENGMEELWESIYDSSADLRQQNQFDQLNVMLSGYGKGAFSMTIAPDTPSAEALGYAKQMIAAIVDQGEGTKNDRADVPSTYWPTDPDAYDMISHYQRFLNVQASVQKGSVKLVSGSGDAAAANQHLNDSYSSFVRVLQAAFTSGETPNLGAMRNIGGATYAVYAVGGTPEFTYTEQPASEAVELHACQGLNACAGHGFGGTGTGPGDGECATSIGHSCATTNSCHHQGGCGQPTDKGSESNWVPGNNDCAGAGGCQTPILADATFSAGPYAGQNVWERARTLFEARMQEIGKGDDLRPVGPVTPRRQSS